MGGIVFLITSDYLFSLGKKSSVRNSITIIIYERAFNSQCRPPTKDLGFVATILIAIDRLVNGIKLSQIPRKSIIKPRCWMNESEAENLFLNWFVLERFSCNRLPVFPYLAQAFSGGNRSPSEETTSDPAAYFESHTASLEGLVPEEQGM